MGEKKCYEKPATTLERQVEILSERGMIIDDPERAMRYLAHINYYHLEAYWLPFEKSRDPHQFHEATTFDSVLDIYLFDRDLRILLLDAIERIELSIKTQWAYTLGIKYGSHAHLDKDLFRFDDESYFEAVVELKAACLKSDEKYIEHFSNKYSEILPPLWAVCEIMSFGKISKWIKNLKDPSDRNMISRKYELDEVVFCSFLHSLNVLRNRCAHHCRVWNRSLKFGIKLPKNPEILSDSVYGNNKTKNKLYNQLCMLLHMMNVINPGHSWKTRLGKLLKRYPGIRPDSMGFPDDWENLPLWQGIFDK